MERGRGDQVDGPAENGGEFVGELLDLPAEAAARLQFLEHVDVIVRGGGPTRDGAEDTQPSDPVPGTHVREASLVDRHPGDRRHVAKVSDRSAPVCCNAGGRAGNNSSCTSVDRIVGRTADTWRDQSRRGAWSL